MKKAELKKILKDNKIPYFSYWSKQRLFDLAGERNLLPPKKENPKKRNEKTPRSLNT